MSDKAKSFFVRLASGIIMLAIIIATGIIGGPVLLILDAAVAFAGYYEYLRVFGLEKKPLSAAGYIFTFIYYVIVSAAGSYTPFALGIVLVCMLVIVMGIYVLGFPKYRVEDVAAVFLGFVYVPVMLSFLYMTRAITLGGENSCIPYFIIFICSWGCDTCAYAVGMLLGKHKLAPVLSPKKSIEGAVGGTLGAALLGLLYASVFGLSKVPCVLICAVGAVVSQVGDLAASAVKRNHDIKDYGNLIPGHGGILDRFDSVILAAPVIYMMAMFYGL